MKKLMVAAFAVAFAAVAQAASVAWGGAIATPEDSYSPLAAGQVAVLLFSESAYTAQATSITGLTVGATADNGGTVVGTYTITDNDATNAFAFNALYTKSGNVDGYYAILIGNEEGTLASYMDMGALTGTTPQSSAVPLQLNADWANDDHLAMNGYTVTVPEPTSALMLLLGMAGLALKRKVA